MNNSKTGQLTISVVMPAYNAAHYMKKSLPPLIAMRDRGDIDEVIVVDDQSTDQTADFARSLGAHVLQTPVNGGPGLARNIAVAEAHGDIIWMVDADVVAHDGGAHRIREGFVDPATVAVFGSYCDNPPAQSFASQYKNLVHRFYHQSGREDASTFWSGCGAIRREKYLEARGFDVERFVAPSIEDIEFGYRLRDRGGKIRLLRDLKGTHLKEWSIGGVLHTDIFKRAIPWSRLMIERGDLTDDLNVSKMERVRAIYAGLLFASFSAPVLNASMWWIPITALFGAALINSRLFSFFLKCKGPLFAAAALGFHQVYYVYSTAAYAFCWLEARLSPPRDHSPLNSKSGA